MRPPEYPPERLLTAVGCVGFVSNDLLGFHLTAFHNAGVHIVSGVVSLYFGLKGTLRAPDSSIIARRPRDMAWP